MREEMKNLLEMPIEELMQMSVEELEKYSEEERAQAWRRVAAERLEHVERESFLPPHGRRFPRDAVIPKSFEKIGFPFQLVS